MPASVQWQKNVIQGCATVPRPEKAWERVGAVPDAVSVGHIPTRIVPSMLSQRGDLDAVGLPVAGDL